MAARIQDLHASFSRHLRAEGRSERTAVVYGQAVRFFSAWLESQGRTATVDELNKAAIREWLATLAETLEKSTVKTRHRGMHRFCSWLVDEGEIPSHPMIGLAQPVPKVTLVPVLSDDELVRLIKACKSAAVPLVALRDEAMIRVLLDCGLRVSELCGLRVTDFDLDNEAALVTGKGGKMRAVYFGHRTAAIVDKYLRRRKGTRWGDSEFLFTSQRGPLSPDGARERVRILGELAGIKGLHPHMFRHTFAHDFLMSGGQERDLKRLAGWTSDAMLERYGASAADQRARSAARKLRRGDRV